MDIKEVDISDEYRWAKLTEGLLEAEAAKVAEVYEGMREKRELISSDITGYLEDLHPADFIEKPSLWQRFHRLITRGRSHGSI